VSSCGAAVESELNSFLALFYDRYVHWLVVPFQYKILVPSLAPPPEYDGHVAAGGGGDDVRLRSLVNPVRPSPVRSSFTLEILSFCVRAHVHRMKFFLLRTRLLGTILKILGQDSTTAAAVSSLTGEEDVALCTGVRCLKLASLKLIRSVLSVKDEFYHRHIVQHNLFAPIFDLFCATKSVGSNLLSSAILEMCDFICLENIKSLIDYIVAKHLSISNSALGGNERIASLEDIANPHVDTFKQLRKAYEDNNAVKSDQGTGGGVLLVPGGGGGGCDVTNMNGNNDGVLINGRGRSMLNKKALEDQRKFREVDEEESYFNDDDDDDTEMAVAVATSNAAGPPEDKISTTSSDHNVATMMEDIKSLN